MKKKILVAITILFAIITIQFVFTNKVQAYTKYNSEISYEENYDGTITVVASGKYIESATIPSTINGKKVTTVSDFEDCKYLNKVTLPDTIEKIGWRAFEGCTSLVEINIPNSVKMIDGYAFASCTSLTNMTTGSASTIGNSAFNGCTKLKTITLSSELEEIEYEAFYNCSSLTNINLPSKLTKIGNSAFLGCKALTSVTIPSNVTSIYGQWYQDGTFQDCTSLQTITINAKSTYLPARMFKGCTALKNITFSNTITSMDEHIFEGCTALTSITLPNNLSEIPYYCFKDCTNLTTINISDTVSEIKHGAFLNCKRLSSIKIPTGVKKITDGGYQEGAFEGCTALKNIYFTKSIQEIGDDAFENGPTGLTIYGYAGTAAKYFAQEKGYTYKECTPVSKITISGAKSVLKKSTITLTANITPSGAFNKSVLWSSSNANVATVDQSGKVTGKNAGTVTITAKAKDGTEIKGTYTVTVKLTDLPFKDLTVDDWYYSAVKYTYERGIIKGTTETTFSPKTKLTRGMLVTILYRMEGSKKVSTTNKFSDVSSTQYYYEAVKWATAKGIIHGYNNGKFGPDNTITRQDLAVILRNYAGYKGKNTNITANLTTFKDGSTVSDYAKTAMQWAVGTGVITGNSSTNTLTPIGTATRADAASMLYKYCTKVK